MYGVEELCDKETQVQQHNNHTMICVQHIIANYDDGFCNEYPNS